MIEWLSRRPARVAAALLPALLGAAPASAGFNVGFYEEPKPARYADMAAAGVRLLVQYLGPDSDPLPLLDEARRHGLRLALQVETRLRPGSEDLGGVERLVRRARGHPALAAWYAFDEPEQHHTLERAVRVVALLKRLDPAHPVLTVHSNSPAAARFSRLADVLGLDYYPVTDQAPLSRTLESVVEYADRLVGWGRERNRPTLFVVQTFSWKDVRPCPRCRFPTRAELRYMAFATLVSGVDGIVFFPRYRIPPDEWGPTVTPVVRELAGLAASLGRNREGTTRRCGAGVRARVLPDGLVIAVNDTPRAAPTVRVVGPATAASVEVVGEGRRLPVIRGEVIDSFGPYGVHVYRFHVRSREPRRQP